MEETLYRFAISFPAFLLAICCHEAAHAWMAKRFGDPTGEQLGRLSLNPVVHFDLIGSLVFPVLAAMWGPGLIVGWAKPVPVDTRRFKNFRKGVFWVSFAGALANFSLMFISCILFGLWTKFVSPEFTYFSFGLEVLKSSVFLNILLAVYNLIPIPPSDGSKMIMSLLDYNSSRKFEQLERYQFLIWIVLIMVFSRWIVTFLEAISNFLLGISYQIFVGF